MAEQESQLVEASTVVWRYMKFVDTRDMSKSPYEVNAATGSLRLLTAPYDIDRAREFVRYYRSPDSGGPILSEEDKRGEILQELNLPDLMRLAATEDPVLYGPKGIGATNDEVGTVIALKAERLAGKMNAAAIVQDRGWGTVRHLFNPDDIFLASGFTVGQLQTGARGLQRMASSLTERVSADHTPARRR